MLVTKKRVPDFTLKQEWGRHADDKQSVHDVILKSVVMLMTNKEYLMLPENKNLVMLVTK